MRRLLPIMLAAVLLLPALVRAQQTATPISPQPEATPEPGITTVVNEALSVLTSARSDLELLANSQLGSERPVGWSGSLDISDPQLGLYIRLDLELLAATVLGVDARPAGWFGALGGSPFSIARDIRHDLELLADEAVGANVRPPGWAGSDPLMRCSRAAQTLVHLIERSGYVLTADATSPEFCAQAELEASLYVEQNMTTLMQQPQVGGGITPGLQGSVRPGITGAAAFLDTDATRRAGSLPRGVIFTAIARSTRSFSNMMLVQGDGFEVFIDYTFTTVSLQEFEGLPGLDTVSTNVRCLAEWCAQ